jgi:alkanesulfonate monooxygenase SsuD/methylene tetrahydromethanopterin reductase-like flavin-dependent oxidoreductase (luciferase family)
MHGQMWDAHVMTRLGYQVPNFTYPGVGSDGLFEAVAAQAVEAEESGFDTVLVMDHFYQLHMLGAPDNAMIECYTLLAALSQRTSRVAPTKEQAQAELDAAVAAIPELAARAGGVILGSPDEVRPIYERILASGVDGVTVNLPANGHVPGRVALLGETLAPVVNRS